MLGGEDLSLPKAPGAFFAAGQQQRPDRPGVQKGDDMSVAGASKMWSPAADHHGLLPWGMFHVGRQREGNEPPGVIMKGPIIVPLVETMQSQSYAAPDDPALEIGLAAVVDQVVGPAKLP